MDTINVAFLPVYQNPYQHLLTDALRQQDVSVEHLKKLPSYAWLVRSRRSVDILHLHWLSGLYMRRLLTPIQLLSFLAKMILAQSLGYKIVWTVHNILPHKLPFPIMHRLVRCFIMSRADAVIAHCEYAHAEIHRLFPRRKPTYIIPIGNYASVYPTNTTKALARQTLGIDQDCFVYLFLGNITPYKGIETFVRTFCAHAAPGDIALVAGRNRDSKLTKSLHALAKQDPRVRIYAEFIPDNEIQNFLLAANVMVLPFEEILTSSSVVTGMSYNLPIIAPALGCLPELVTPATGILYKADEPNGLQAAMRTIQSMDTAEMGRQARARVEALQWDDIAQKTLAVYQACLK